MGIKTRQQIIQEGLLAAGDTKLTTRAVTWLNTWLASMYAGFPWPFLLITKEGISLAQGAGVIQIGGGLGGESKIIRRIVDPIYLYDAAKSTRYQVRIRNALETTTESDLALLDSSKAKGLPTEARVHAVDGGTYGQWEIRFNLYADKAYLVKVPYYVQPADLALDADVPKYPNDRTMIKAIEVEALRYKKDPAHADEREVLARMVNDDKLKFGTIDGQQDEWGLDPVVFR